MKLKKRKKRFIKDSKNFTIFYIDFWGNEWVHCEPCDILYFKYNQYLINAAGTSVRISEMNLKGYEYYAYLNEDIKKRGNGDERLENELKEYIERVK